jgi:hypothetical protein
MTCFCSLFDGGTITGWNRAPTVELALEDRSGETIAIARDGDDQGEIA